MKWCCDECDNTKKIKSESKHFESLTHDELEKITQIKHIFKTFHFL